MELKSFRTYLSEQQSLVSEALPALLLPLLKLAGTAALSAGAQAVASKALEKKAPAPETAGGVAAASNEIKKEKGGGATPPPPYVGQQGSSRTDSEHRGNKYVVSFSGSNSPAYNAMLLGKSIAGRAQ